MNFSKMASRLGPKYAFVLKTKFRKNPNFQGDPRREGPDEAVSQMVGSGSGLQISLDLDPDSVSAPGSRIP